MPNLYKGKIPIIETDEQITNLSHPKGAKFGLVPRDYSRHPEKMFDPPSDMKLIVESDWDAYYDEQEESQSSLEHIYLSGPNGEPAFVNLDQNGYGDCWTFSTGQAIMVDLLKRGLEVPRLNPHAVAVILNQLNGGWCGMSAKFGEENGYAVDGTGPGQWPGHSRDRIHDTPALRAEMAKHKIKEAWVDLTREVYDQNLTRNQCATDGFNNIPGPRDYNFWRHSVLGMRWVRVERNSWGQLILNSWPNWGHHGLAVLRGSQAVCNGGLGIRLTVS